MNRALLVAVLLGVVCTLAVDPIFHIWYISDGQGDDNNEGDKEYPFKTLGRALEKASDGDVILVESDTYTGPGNCDVLIDKSVFVRSINGDPKQVIFDCGDSGVAAMHIDAMNVTLSAITIQSCSPVGAVRITRGHVVATTCVFHENTGDNGGAFFIGSGCHLSVSNSICEYNSATNGGFAYVSSNAILKVDKNTRLNENRASVSGGAIYLEKDSTCEMHDTLLIANEAVSDGGAIFAAGTSFTMTNTQFTMNKAKSAKARGGAMCMLGASAANLDNCQFVSSEAGSHGGALYASDTTTIDYDDCSLEGNSAGGNGGGICLDGAKTGVVGRSNTLLANWADGNGGGIYASGASIVTDQDRFISNSGDSGASYYLQASSQLNASNAFYGEGRAQSNGGGIFLQDSSMFLTKCTISDNAGNTQSAGIYCGNSNVRFTLSYIKENIGANLFCDKCKVFDDKSQCNCNTC